VLRNLKGFRCRRKVALLAQDIAQLLKALQAEEQASNSDAPNGVTDVMPTLPPLCSIQYPLIVW